jgi:hypothetical protein
MKITQTYDNELTRLITVLKVVSEDLHIKNTWFDRCTTKGVWFESASSSFTVPVNKIKKLLALSIKD